MNKVGTEMELIEALVVGEDEELAETFEFPVFVRTPAGMFRVTGLEWEFGNGQTILIAEAINE